MKRIMLLGALICLCLGSAKAQDYTENNDTAYTSIEEDFSSVITQSDVIVTITNDELHPWHMEDNIAVINGDNENDYYAASLLTFSYFATEKTELYFEWASYNYAYHTGLDLYIDGIFKDRITSRSYNSRRLLLDAGQHIIAFKDSVSNRNYTQNWSGIKNIQIKQVEPLESTVLTEKSNFITFINDSDLPWIIDDGFIRSGNNYADYTASRFSSTFTIDKTSRLSYQVQIPYTRSSWYDNYYYSDHSLYIDINGKQWECWEKETDWKTDMFVLEPGTYTITWIDTIRGYSSYFDCKSKIRNIELVSDWIEVELDMPGTLGVEVLYKVDILNDVHMLKIKGTINSTDWATIKQMNNLAAIDLSEAIFESVPDYAFDGMTWLGNVILPEGIKRIGKYSFRETRILRIDIPSTVTAIDSYAFQKCNKLRDVILPNNLESIGYAAFDQCSSIETIYMHNNVLSIGAYAFSSCSSLKSIHFSDALTEISEWACGWCSTLKDVHLPIGLTRINYEAFIDNTNLRHIDFPSTLKTIVKSAFYNCGIDSVLLPANLAYLGSNSFSNCNNLKYLELPSYIERTDYRFVYNDYCDGQSWTTDYSGYNSNFTGCPSLETIVMRSATPPVIDSDPFSNSRDKNNITIQVPSFAVVNYKLDSYWYQFGQIVEGDDIDYWKITSTLSLTNNRRMKGKPDIDLYNGGQLLIGGNAPMEISQFKIYPNQSNPGRLLNNCDKITADTVLTEWSVDADKWYFITPLHDVELNKIVLTDDASYVFRYYDSSNRAQNGTGSSWKNVEDNVLLAGQGYIFQCNKATTVVMPAEADCHVQIFNSADVTKTLSVYESASSSDKNWNFVGNPYPCYYDMYYMDFTAPITVWTGNTYKAYSIVDDEYVLSPMQAFFVQKPDEVDKIVFHKEGRQLTLDISRASYAGVRTSNESISKRNLFDIKIESDNMFDETRVVLNESASMEYEIECDASKFMSFDSTVPQICTFEGEKLYAINERPISNGYVGMAYSAATPGAMTISAIRTDGSVTLYDNLLNESVNLAEQDYTFITDATGGLNTTRFKLFFSSGNTTEVMNSIESDNESVKVQKEGITVSTKKGAEIIIYTVDGIKVFEDISDGTITFISLTSGQYIVKVNSEIVRIMIY